MRTVRKRSKKPNLFSKNGRELRPAFVDYKDVPTLKKFMTGQGKLLSRKRSGVSAAYQRAIATAVKRARFMGLLPYVGD